MTPETKNTAQRAIDLVNDLSPFISQPSLRELPPVKVEKVILFAANSTMLNGIGYDPRSETLYLRFNSLKVYKYPNVSATKFAVIITAPSLGRILNELILRDKGYSFTRLELKNPEEEIEYAETIGSAAITGRY